MHLFIVHIYNVNELHDVFKSFQMTEKKSKVGERVRSAPFPNA